MEERAVGEVSPDSTSSQDSISAHFQPPRFTLPLVDTTIQETEEMQLKCIVTGTLMPVVRWTYNGQEIRPDDRFHIFFFKCAQLTKCFRFFSIVASIFVIRVIPFSPNAKFLLITNNLYS